VGQVKSGLFSLYSERILLTPPGVLPLELRQAIREHREELLTLLEVFEERAGIMEYYAGLERPKADALAWQCVHSQELV